MEKYVTDEERNKLIKLELVLPQIEKSMSKILENQEILTLLKIESDENKKFRDGYRDELAKLLDTRLNSTAFEQALNEQIEKQTEIYLNKDGIRKDLTNRIKEVFRIEFKNAQLWMYIKLTTVVGGIATTVATLLVQGVIGG